MQTLSYVELVALSDDKLNERVALAQFIADAHVCSCNACKPSSARLPVSYNCDVSLYHIANLAQSEHEQEKRSEIRLR